MKIKLALFFVLFTTHLSCALTYTVTNCADSGAGSLREGLNNVGVGTPFIFNTINFNIPATDPGYTTENGVSFWKITSSSTLGAGVNLSVLRYVAILGSTQTTNQGNTNPQGPEIMINGPSIESVIFPIESYCTIEGLAIANGVRAAAIKSGSTTAGGLNHIYNCYLGLHPDGVTPAPNFMGVFLLEESNYNVIGSTDPAKRNVISGNSADGINIRSNYNRVIGNYLGTDRTGTLSVPNGRAIGLGTIVAEIPAQYNIVGGTTAAERNIINGPIWILGAGTMSNEVKGNFIGTNADGISRLGDGAAVSISNGAKYNLIGGTAAGAGNVICYSLSGTIGLGTGVDGDNSGTNYNKVIGNYLGTNAEGANLSCGSGISIGSGINFTEITNNTIANAAYAGIWITGEAFSNTISRNSTHSNSGLGIDLAPYGVTLNDSVGHAGPNLNMNFPVISSTRLSGTIATIEGTAPIGSLVEVFIADLHPSGYGEGKTYLGAVNADASGIFSITVTGVSASDVITATATDSQGNTSEFCQNLNIGITTTTIATTTTSTATTTTTLPVGSSGEIYYHPDTKKVQASFTTLPAGRAEVKLFSPEGIELGAFTETTSASDGVNRSFALQFREKPARDYYIVIITVDNKFHRKIALPIF